MSHCVAVAREPTGRLGEIRVPCLLVVEKSGGSWVTIKDHPGLDHLAPTRVVEVLVEGWYILSAGPAFLFVGDTFNAGSGTSYATGPYP